MATPPAAPRASRRRVPVVLLGLLVVIVLVALYLSDCIPGLGSGSPRAPSPAPASTEAAPVPAAAEQAEARIVVTVQGDRCRRGQAAAAPCPEVCAALPRDHADTVVIVIQATEGRHGTVEELRQCIVQAGFANVRILAE